MNGREGNALLWFGIGVAIVVAVVLGFSAADRRSGSAPDRVGLSIEQLCTQDVRVCPDGTSVGRTGPACEFELCPPAPTATIAVLLNFIGQWDSLQRSIPLSPTLGASAWHPTDIQFIGNDRMLVRFEDGHVSATAVFVHGDADQFEYVTTFQDEPWTSTRWQEIVAQYGDVSFEPKTFVTSIVRGDAVETFSGWTEVPENVFVR